MEKILTVVIPSYNTESYINECVPSFLDRRILDDLELLIIDDGSTDRTPELADQLQGQYPNCIRVIHKINGGHGSVINCGIKNARGKYFKVVDGDDWVDTENFVHLIMNLKLIDADLILNPYYKYHITKKQKLIETVASLPSGEVLEFDSTVDSLGILGIHAITIKTSLLRNNNISMAEHCYYEDSEYDIYPIPYINTVMSYDYPVTVYRIGNPTQSVNINNVLKNLEMHKKIVGNLIDFYDALPDTVSNAKKEYIEKFVISRINSQYMIYLKASLCRDAKEGIRCFDESLKNHSMELYKKSGLLHIKILRTHTWIGYTAVQLMFRLMRVRRGF